MRDTRYCNSETYEYEIEHLGVSQRTSIDSGGECVGALKGGVISRENATCLPHPVSSEEIISIQEAFRPFLEPSSSNLDRSDTIQPRLIEAILD
jgi:hypothetical protein